MEQSISVFDEPPLTEGEWAGWTPIQGHDPFEDRAGPFYSRFDDAGRRICALRVLKHHTNGSGTLHGGCLMTLADLSLFAIARQLIGRDRAVTVSLNGDFVGAAAEGDLLSATGEVARAGGSLVFVRGQISAEGERPILVFSGVLKRLRPRG